MKLWGLYIAEREGADIIYNDDGFVTFKMQEDGLYVIDVFVVKEKRKTGAVQELWDSLIEKIKPKIVYGMTDIAALNWKNSHAFMVKFGFTPYSQEGNTIYYYKEIV